MLTTVHKPTDVRIFYREAKSLVSAGFSVCILGPNKGAAQVEGIRIYPLAESSNRIHRLLLGWMAVKTALRLRGKLYIFHDPELIGAGLVLRCFGKKVVFDCHENVHLQILQKRYIPRPIRWLAIGPLWITLWIASRLFTGNIAATESILKRIPKRRSVLIRNYAPASALHDASKDLPVTLRKNIFIYAGGLTQDRGIAELQQAFRGLTDMNAELWLVGDFDDRRFREQILETLPPNVKWLGSQPFPVVMRLLREAKIGVVLLHDTPNHRQGFPLKLFEYLGAGLPVIASNLPQLTPIMEGCGFQVDPRDVGEIRGALRSILSDDAVLLAMSKTARERTRKSYMWEDEGERLVQFCRELISADNVRH